MQIKYRKKTDNVTGKRIAHANRKVRLLIECCNMSTIM